MIVRLRTATGQSRIEIDADAGVLELRGLIAQSLGAAAENTLASLAQDFASPLRLDSATASVKGLGLKNGDVVFARLLHESIDLDSEGADDKGKGKAVASSPADRIASARKSIENDEDPIDVALAQEDRQIRRPRDPNFCKHGPNAMCEYCIPLSAYDKGYLEREKINYMSFHAWLRKLSGDRKERDVSLERPNFRVLVPCPSGHAPWPASMCAKCQPNSVTLQSQEYRHVDHLEFASPALVESFIGTWRATGQQRHGFLLGHYARYAKVPLGIKAVAVWIYEPPQVAAHDGFELDPYPAELEKVQTLAAICGLRVIGQIYTDLVDDGEGTGKVLYKRSERSTLLNSGEIRAAADMQARFPMITRHAAPDRATGKRAFGSRFLTVVVSGDAEGMVTPEAYMCSDLCAGLFEADVVDASIDPRAVLVRQSTRTQYVPEIFYSRRNEYGITVKSDARDGIPVEFGTVTLTHGFPVDGGAPALQTDSFPAANRPQALFAFPSLQALQRHVAQCSGTAQILLSLDALLFLESLAILDGADWANIGAVVRHRLFPDSVRADEAAVAVTALEESPQWRTVLTLAAQEAAPQVHGMGQPSAAAASAAASTTAVVQDEHAAPESWLCPHCTYENFGASNDCEMCSLPRNH